MARVVEAEIEEAGVRTERGYHLYLMNNDQRRHLHHHFENIDRYRAEFMMPFYDAEFVKLMLSVPKSRPRTLRQLRHSKSCVSLRLGCGLRRRSSSWGSRLG